MQYWSKYFVFVGLSNLAGLATAGSVGGRAIFDAWKRWREMGEIRPRTRHCVGNTKNGGINTFPSPRMPMLGTKVFFDDWRIIATNEAISSRDASYGYTGLTGPAPFTRLYSLLSHAVVNYAPCNVNCELTKLSVVPCGGDF